ncbi:MAG: M48 family metallopeptidase [Rhodobacteraceae bacterium]|nr:M48 family metallopeptidase [Paracoccaceae bacterium]
MVKTVERLVLPGDPAIEVQLRRSAQARRLSLRVSRVDGRVTLSLPKGLGLGVAEAFLDRKAGWVRRHLADQPAPELPVIGSVVPIEGREHRIVAAVRGRARLTEGVLEVNPARAAAPQVAAVLKSLARDRLARACDTHAARLGRGYTSLVMRDPRSRWGSCSSAGRLMFSWRLAMAPPEILDYVAAHEIAHLVEMNHSPAFWRQVARVCPDHSRHRAWLRDHGAELHRIRFAA